MGERITYIDSLRGFAVILMVQQHLISWLWEKKWISYSLTFPQHPVMLSLNFLGNFSAAMFLLAAGAGSAILFEKGGSWNEYFKRGFFIFLCGYLLNITSPHWFRPGSWYILHTMGICIMLSPVFNKFRISVLLLLSVLIIIIPVFFQTWLGTPLMLGNNFMNDTGRSWNIFRLALAEGHFPLFPWTALFITGIISCRWIKSDRYDKILVAAFLLIISGIILLSLNNYGYYFATGGNFFRMFIYLPYIYPPLPPLVLIISGVSVITLYLLIVLANNSIEKILKPAASAGRLSFTWFFIHILIFNELMIMLGLKKKFSAAVTLGVVFMTISVMIGLSIAWERRGLKYGVEWFMRKVTKL